MGEIYCDGYNIKIYDQIDDYPIGKNSIEDAYVILCVSSLDTEKIRRAKSMGFRFHDRVLRMKIDLKQTKKRRSDVSEKLITVPLNITQSLSDDMYKLACETYTTDRRFHLEENYDMELASKSLAGYFSSFRNRNIRIFESRVDQELLGFTVLELKENGVGENVLGVTKNNMRGKMSAWGIYDGMLNGMESEKDLNCSSYYGNVSSSNVSSINLHIQLGATVDCIYDEYIKKIGKGEIL